MLTGVFSARNVRKSIADNPKLSRPPRRIPPLDNFRPFKDTSATPLANSPRLHKGKFKSPPPAPKSWRSPPSNGGNGEPQIPIIELRFKNARALARGLDTPGSIPNPRRTENRAAQSRRSYSPQ